MPAAWVILLKVKTFRIWYAFYSKTAPDEKRKIADPCKLRQDLSKCSGNKNLRATSCSETPYQGPWCVEYLPSWLCPSHPGGQGRDPCMSYSCPDFSREAAFPKAAACAVPDL